MIRLAKESELLEIMKVINDAKELFRQDGSDQWQDLDNYPNEETILTDINRCEMYVNIKENKIVGCVVLSNLEEECYQNIFDGNWINDSSYMVVHRIAVKKEYYHQGIAKELLEEMIKIAKGQNVDSIKVDTKKENFRMISLLRKLDFQIVGTINLLRSDCLDKERIALELNLN